MTKALSPGLSLRGPLVGGSVAPARPRARPPTRARAVPPEWPRPASSDGSRPRAARPPRRRDLLLGAGLWLGGAAASGAAVSGAAGGIGPWLGAAAGPLEGTRGDAVGTFDEALAAAMRAQPERLAALEEEARAGIVEGPGYAILDTRSLLPLGLASELHERLTRDLAAPRVVLRLDKPHYVQPKRLAVVPSHRHLGRPFLTWLEALMIRLAREIAPGREGDAAAKEIRLSAAEAPKDRTEAWHVDGSRLTASVSLLGPGTEVAPRGRFDRAQDRFVVDDASVVRIPPGHTVVFLGGALDPGTRATIHRAPAYHDDRLVFIVQN